MAGEELMDMMMRGLAAPQAVHALGRPDLVGNDRPGAALMGMVLEAVRGGAFERVGQAPPEPRAHRRAPAESFEYRARPDFAVFDMDEEREMTL